MKFRSGNAVALLTAIVASMLMLACGSRAINYKIECNYPITDPQFERAAGTLLGPPILPGNTTVELLNGDQIFPAMLQAITEAKQTITFETFVYWSGMMGRKFADALAERARSGVRVSVLIDAIGGSKIDKSYITELKEAGAKVVFYHELKWHDLGSAMRVNHRTHRKLLVVDGKVGFTGGVGIADEWLGHAQDPEHWRDTHYRVEGPVVAQMQSAFIDSWMQETGEVLHDDGYFPPLQPVGKLKAQCFKSSYRDGSQSMQLMFLLSIAAARSSIRLETPYFVPDQLTIDTLIEAKHRGVNVQIIVPGTNMDEQVVQKASRECWGQMLKCGIQIYEYEPTMFHCKLMIVDEYWTSVGSSNFDNRSFKLNEEANLNILDADFAAKQVRVFEDDLRNSKEITFEAWSSRPALDKLAEGMASLLRSQL